MRLLASIAEWQENRKTKKISRLMYELYPKKADRVCGYFDMGVNLLEANIYSKGQTLDHIIIFPSDDPNKGAHVNVKVNDVSESQSDKFMG